MQGKGNKEQRIISVIQNLIGIVDSYNKISLFTDSHATDICKELEKQLFGENSENRDLVTDKMRAAFALVKRNGYLIGGCYAKIKSDLNEQEFTAVEKIFSGLHSISEINRRDEQDHFERQNEGINTLMVGLVLLGCAMIAYAIGPTLPAYSKTASLTSDFVGFTALFAMAYGYKLTKTDLSKAIVDHGKTVTEGLKLLEAEMKKTVGDDAGRTV